MECQKYDAHTIIWGILHDDTWDGKKERKKDRHLRQWKNENELPQVGFEPTCTCRLRLSAYHISSSIFLQRELKQTDYDLKTKQNQIEDQQKKLRDLEVG